MPILGKLFRRVRAGEQRSLLQAKELDAPASITVTSSAFADGSPMPQSSAGKGVGEDISPPLQWDGVPPQTQQLVLIIEDVDVPLPRALFHTVAVVEPTLNQVAAGSLQPGSDGIRFLRADLGNRGYAGPRPIPGHGPHHYRFLVFAVDQPLAESITKPKALVEAMKGHVLARGVLTGTYERGG